MVCKLFQTLFCHHKEKRKKAVWPRETNRYSCCLLQASSLIICICTNTIMTTKMTAAKIHKTGLGMDSKLSLADNLWHVGLLNSLNSNIGIYMAMTGPFKHLAMWIVYAFSIFKKKRDLKHYNVINY